MTETAIDTTAGTDRKTYRVTAERDGRYWVLAVPGIDKATETRRLDQADELVRDLITIHTGEDPESFDVLLEPQGLPVVDRARHLREQARESAQMAAVGTAIAVRQLHDEGLPMRDIGVLLGMTHQRVAQVLDGERRSSGVSSSILTLTPSRTGPPAR